jgi:hypothetical protein
MARRDANKTDGSAPPFGHVADLIAKTLVREKCDDDEDWLERLARSSFDHLLPAQGSVKPGRGSPSYRGTLPPDLRSRSGGCLAGSIIKSMGLSLATRSARNLDVAQLHLDPDQTVVPHGPDRNLDVYKVAHEFRWRARGG